MGHPAREKPMHLENKTIPSENPGNEFLCALDARQTGAQLKGTVPQTSTWFLLEHPHPWTEKAFKESAIPAEVKAHINHALETMPFSRLLLIKQTRLHSREGLRFFIARSDPRQPTLYEYDLPRIEALCDLDLVLAATKGHGKLRSEPLYLVCTNGARDQCCSKFGGGVYRQMREAAGDAVWQASHVSGHRFAANVLCFPHALYYGFVEPKSANELISAYENNQLILDLFRGRSSYSREVQAAEGFLREETGELRLAAYQWVSSEAEEENVHKVLFTDAVQKMMYSLWIESSLTEQEFAVSCTVLKEKKVDLFTLQKMTSRQLTTP
jgi:hypothetical protein